MGRHHMGSGRLTTLSAAAAWCLVLWVTAACAAGGVRALPPSTPTLPSVSTTEVAASGTEPAQAAPAESVKTVGRDGGAARHWGQVLDRLDEARCRAFAHLRPELLTRVYVAGSTVLHREQAVLHDYRDRGIRLLGVRLHRTSLRLASTLRGQVTLRVVERLRPTTAVVGSRRVRLPVDAPTLRVLQLVRDGPGWRIAAARRVAG
jgi:hypothetical protein